MQTKGIILAGGTGSRLFPATLATSKQLIPIYDKPMIYYSLGVFMLAGIREILIITTFQDFPNFKRLLGTGIQFGMTLNYLVQDKPNGLAEAFIIGREFIGSNPVALILGDNIFHGHGLPDICRNALDRKSGATIFAYWVSDPNRYGVVEFEKSSQKARSIEEKPVKPKSNYAVTGLYFFDNDVVEIASKVIPSPRGELEITDVIEEYLKRDNLHVEILGRGFAWLDTGTHESLFDATAYVRAIQKRQGQKIMCLEEIAFSSGWIDENVMRQQIDLLGKTDYSIYLTQVIENAQNR